MKTSDEIIALFHFHTTETAIQCAIIHVNQLLHTIKKFRATTRTLAEYRKCIEIKYELEKKLAFYKGI